MTFFGVVKNEEEWNKVQVNFLQTHQYFTASAGKMRKDKKEQHLEMIKALVPQGIVVIY
jgi:hypothetical protein